eukprot:CAMPEP_0202869908 /NCGR_PEP_ID=MMETSP1391-20130828/13764_1 /ASSEMBLY_ACC=CAM_ASM_000867 /TAXON_ID=1034604 /ORGANISM="Chlamydomonas leiostraca, Strain SAG 11-49" /LENGTH=48 /DNA_ID= /DNA_START= /DNA_END= /DNA_ORIENTATION=
MGGCCTKNTAVAPELVDGMTGSGRGLRVHIPGGKGRGVTSPGAHPGTP